VREGFDSIIPDHHPDGFAGSQQRHLWERSIDREPYSESELLSVSDFYLRLLLYLHPIVLLKEMVLQPVTHPEDQILSGLPIVETVSAPESDRTLAYYGLLVPLTAPLGVALLQAVAWSASLDVAPLQDMAGSAALEVDLHPSEQPLAVISLVHHDQSLDLLLLLMPSRRQMTGRVVVQP